MSNDFATQPAYTLQEMRDIAASASNPVVIVRALYQAERNLVYAHSLGSGYDTTIWKAAIVALADQYATVMLRQRGEHAVDATNAFCILNNAVAGRPLGADGATEPW